MQIINRKIDVRRKKLKFKWIQKLELRRNQVKRKRWKISHNQMVRKSCVVALFLRKNISSKWFDGFVSCNSQGEVQGFRFSSCRCLYVSTWSRVSLRRGRKQCPPSSWDRVCWTSFVCYSSDGARWLWRSLGSATGSFGHLGWTKTRKRRFSSQCGKKISFEQYGTSPFSKSATLTLELTMDILKPLSIEELRFVCVVGFKWCEHPLYSTWIMLLIRIELLEFCLGDEFERYSTPLHPPVASTACENPNLWKALLCSTSAHLSSFLPSCSILWNTLPSSVTSCSSLSLFASSLDFFFVDDKFSYGLSL